MCGIVGWWRLERFVDPAVLDRACDSLIHRGPNDRGVYVSKHVGLAMRRLSIIDLDSGSQPIWNEDRTKLIVFNGEIYNYRELRRELLDCGHSFVTQSDTEAILHAYEEWGDDCPNHLQGMFAFAIWDVRNERLFVARDRFGIKPLYYRFRDDELQFASELKALHVFDSASPELDVAATEQFFTFLYVPGEGTLLRGVKKLLPGHSLVIERSKMSVKRWYRLPPQLLAPRVLSEERMVEESIAVLRQAVERHMISDVSLGAFLSGGIDSSI
ncbi:MAG: asparagine synthase (glutamine-hydrolyzing), partial [Bdellovibrionales bacterium]|nr:asparagine synthase (glutamine-hydrolyzing) [Bdellovibrionales bacterium]